MLFSYNYVYFRCPWWLETYLDLNANQSPPPPPPPREVIITFRVEVFYPPPPPSPSPSNNPSVETVSYCRMDQITHWCYILTNGQYTLITSHKAQPKYTLWNGLGLDFTGLIPQGHDKVISRSRQGRVNTGEKQVKIACFFVFFYNYVHFRYLGWPKIYLDSNKDLYQNTPRDHGIIKKRVGGVIPH